MRRFARFLLSDAVSSPARRFSSQGTVPVLTLLPPQPLSAKKNEIEKWRKEFKDQWTKEQKRMVRWAWSLCRLWVKRLKINVYGQAVLNNNPRQQNRLGRKNLEHLFDEEGELCLFNPEGPYRCDQYLRVGVMRMDQTLLHGAQRWDWRFHLKTRRNRFSLGTITSI